MLGICPETKRCAGMGDRESRNPKEGSRKRRLVHGHVVEVGGLKLHTISLFCNINPCLPSLAFRRTVLATIFSISIVRMRVPSSRDTFHSAEKDDFLIKRADDGEAAARAQGERGTGA